MPEKCNTCGLAVEDIFTIGTGQRVCDACEKQIGGGCNNYEMTAQTIAVLIIAFDVVAVVSGHSPGVGFVGGAIIIVLARINAKLRGILNRLPLPSQGSIVTTKPKNGSG